MQGAPYLNLTQRLFCGEARGLGAAIGGAKCIGGCFKMPRLGKVPLKILIVFGFYECKYSLRNFQSADLSPEAWN